MRPRRSHLSSTFSFLTVTALLGLAMPLACDSTATIDGVDRPGPDDDCSGLDCPGSGECARNSHCPDGQFCTDSGKCLASCDTCGSPCEKTSECPAGQFCSQSKTCEAECTAGQADERCGTAANGKDYLCNEEGRCTKTTDDGLMVDDGQGGQMNMGGSSSCIDVDVEFTPEIPNVVLLIDQSGSMNAGDGFGARVEQEIEAGDYVPWGCPSDPDDPADSPDQRNADWRWNVVRNVLFNPTSGVVLPLEDQVRFGMALYTSEDGFGQNMTRTCPMLTEVEIDFGNYEAMLGAMECNGFPNAGDTPTRESLRDTANALAAADLDGPKIIVLATDGEPDNCTCPDWSGNHVPSSCYDQATVERGDPPVEMSPARAEQYDVAEEAARIYAELGIIVHVIDVSTPTNTSLRAHLTSVATAGGGGIFDGTRPSGLVDAFRTIIDGARSCVIELSGEISGGKESTGRVTLNGEELMLVTSDDEDGWKVNSSTEIELTGAPCELIKQGQHDLKILFPCDAFVPTGPK